MIDLSNKNALVTGAAVGIGRGVSKVLAEQGANVVVSDIDSDGAKSTSEEIIKAGGLSQSAQLDVTDKGSVQTLVSDLSTQLGHIDIVVNNAGVVGAQGWWERKIPNDDDWDMVLAINLRGVVNVSLAVEEGMKGRKEGKIINIASIIASTGFNGLSVYAASKSALIGFTKSLSRELGKANITVNSISPGYLETDMTQTMKDENLAKIVRRSPMNRLASLSDVSNAIIYLLSNEAQSVTGINLIIDAGSTA